MNKIIITILLATIVITGCSTSDPTGDRIDEILRGMGHEVTNDTSKVITIYH